MEQGLAIGAIIAAVLALLSVVYLGFLLPLE
jgi:hypothetical protein